MKNLFYLDKKTILILVLFLIFSQSNVFSQSKSYDFNDKKEVIARLYKDIAILCSDSLQGRETGTVYEKMAYEYLIAQYKQIGLQPILPNNSYLQNFEFTEGFKILDSTSVIFKNKELELQKDYFPMHFTTNKDVSGEIVNVGFGIKATELNYDDYKDKTNLKDKIFVIEYSAPDGYTSQKFNKYYKASTKITTAIENGAKAIIFINSDKSCPNPTNETDLKVYDLNVPVIFATKNFAKQLKNADGKSIYIKTKIEKNKKNASNVIGYIDNNAEKTIVIGAHYDHLGMGFFGSRYTGTPQIHNGADDNASGTAGMLELSRYFKTKSLKRNIIFIAFTAEEKGLYGSSYFTKSKDYDISKIDYMINLDMLGRLDSAKKTAAIIGTGTTPVWDTLIKQIKINNLKTRTSKSGMGGSDQTSFYLKNIPVLFVFAGSHEDYHKPTDDIEKINFEGQYNILNFVKTLIEATDTIKTFPFVATEDKSQTTTRGGNSIGIIPDHSYDGKGLRVEGVLNGKQAKTVGIKAGDIIIKINATDIIDVYSYMKALNSFKKGDKIKISILRTEKIEEFEIEL